MATSRATFLSIWLRNFFARARSSAISAAPIGIKARHAAFKSLLSLWMKATFLREMSPSGKMRTALKRGFAMQKMGIVLASAMIAWALPVHANQSKAGDRDAYATAVVCTIVASKKGNQDGFTKGSRAVNFLGDRLGYSRKKQSSDLVGMASTLATIYRERPAEEANDVGRCRRRGFFS